MNNNFYQQLGPDPSQRFQAAAHQGRQPGQRGFMVMPNTMQRGQNDQLSSPHSQPMLPAMSPPTPMLAVDSLDDIMSHNMQNQGQERLRRRRSVPRPFSPHRQVAQDDTDRRMSMMEFGSSNDNYRGFQFSHPLPTTAPPTSMSDGLPTFANMNTVNSPMTMAPMPPHSASFSQPLAMSDPNDFSAISPTVMSNMMSFSNLNMGQMPSDPNSMALFTSPNMSPRFGNNGMEPVSPDFAMDMNTAGDPLSAVTTNPPASLGMDDGDDDMMTVPQVFGDSSSGAPQQPQGNGGAMPNYAMAPPLSREASNATSIHPSPVSPLPNNVSQLSTPRPNVAPETPMIAPALPATPAEVKAEKNIYSKTGFDMIRALYYVATRPHPEVNLGAVDLSCAFVVCDVTMNDCPIIYVSDNFQNLTGYSRHDIIGQNCRFLQAPDGQVEAGSQREFVENDAVYNLKRKIAEGKEVQQSLINYRKGGKPFLNLLTMIPIPWDTKDIRYFIGFQIDLVECPDAIAGNDKGSMQVSYTHNEIGQYIWTPPSSSQWGPESGQTLGVDDVSTLLQQLKPGAAVSDWHKQSWDKMLLENAADMIHVLSLKGLFMYLSPSCKRILEYDVNELLGHPLAEICHPSDIIPVTRELKEATAGNQVNVVFRVRRRESGYTWFESHGSLFVEQGKGRKCVVLVGRKRPVFALSRRSLEANGGITDNEVWSKMSTSGMFLFVSAGVRSLLDLMPDALVGTSIQDLMRKETKKEFGRAIEKARRGKIVSCKHEVHNKRGQVLQAVTVLYPGDAREGQKPTFLLAQTKLTKASSRALAPASSTGKSAPSLSAGPPEDPLQPSRGSLASPQLSRAACGPETGVTSEAKGGGLSLGSQDLALASDDNIFDELKTTRCTSWQYELRQMEKLNRILAEELGQLLNSKKKRKRRKGGNQIRDCANCHTRNTPEWRRGPSGNRDLCNSCGLRWAKQTGRVSPRNSSRGGNGDSHSKKSSSPNHRNSPSGFSPNQASPLHLEVAGAGGLAPGFQPQSQGGAAGSAGTADSSRMTHSSSSVSAPNNASSMTAGSVSSGGGTMSFKGLMPPPSQPLLEGGSGTDGHSMKMASIQEEREASA